MNRIAKLGLIGLTVAASACSVLENDKIDYKSATKGSSLDVPPDLVELLARREAARTGRDFTTADRLRDEITGRGFEIVDTPEGPTLRRS